MPSSFLFCFLFVLFSYYQQQPPRGWAGRSAVAGRLICQKWERGVGGERWLWVLLIWTLPPSLPPCCLSLSTLYSLSSISSALSPRLGVLVFLFVVYPMSSVYPPHAIHCLLSLSFEMPKLFYPCTLSVNSSNILSTSKSTSSSDTFAGAMIVSFPNSNGATSQTNSLAHS